MAVSCPALTRRRSPDSAEDDALRTQLDELTKEIHGLKKQKEDAKRVENFTEANRLKEQLAEKEK